MASEHIARMAKRRKRQPANLDGAKAVLWDTLMQAKSVLDAAVEPELKLRACHCVSQIVGQFTKIYEVSELERRVALLEAEGNADED
jgi:hypothetical protein